MKLRIPSFLRKPNKIFLIIIASAVSIPGLLGIGFSLQQTFTSLATVNCPSGYSWNNFSCVQIQPNRDQCPSGGYYVGGGVCHNPSYSCPDGGLLNGTNCDSSPSNPINTGENCSSLSNGQARRFDYGYDNTRPNTGFARCSVTSNLDTNLNNMKFIESNDPGMGGYGNTVFIPYPANLSSFGIRRTTGNQSDSTHSYLIEAVQNAGSCVNYDLPQPHPFSYGTGYSPISNYQAHPANDVYILGSGTQDKVWRLRAYNGFGYNSGNIILDTYVCGNFSTMSDQARGLNQLDPTPPLRAFTQTDRGDTKTEFYFRPNHRYGSYSQAAQTNNNAYSSSCPGGWTPYSSTQCYVTSNAVSYTVDDYADIGNGSCNPSTVVVGAFLDCTFPLQNAPSGVPYVLPGSVLAAVQNSLNVPCIVSGSNLVCNGLRADDTNVGQQGVYILLPSQNWTQRATITVTSTAITSANIGNSGDCVNTLNVTIPATFTCTFPLTGGTVYTLPAGGIVANASSATGNSNPCTISGSTLTCNNIPSTNGTAGLQNVDLYIDGSSTPNDRGDVTLLAPVITINDSNVQNSGNCTSASQVVIGNLYSCNFPLTGNTYNLYQLPANGVVARTEQGANTTGNSSACTISSTTLTCTNIPTTPNTTPGAANVTLQFNGTGGYFDRGDVNLVPTVITSANIGNSNSCSTSLNILIGNAYDCDFPLSGGVFYTLPQGGVQARSEQGIQFTLSTNNCSIINNNILRCISIPTSNLSQGVGDVALQFGGTGSFEDRGVVNLFAPYSIGLSDIGSSQNCITTFAVLVGDTYICTFPLTGSPVNTYSLPNDGIVARTTQGNVNSTPSPNCTIIDNSTPQARLSCAQIPTQTSTNPLAVGAADVQIRVGANGTFTKRGDVLLIAEAIEIDNIQNSTNCINTKKIILEFSYVCDFPLTGSSGNTYALPQNGVIGQTSQTTNFSRSSPLCIIVNNTTPQALLRCEQVETLTTGGGVGNLTAGLGDVRLQVNGTGAFEKRGEVDLVVDIDEDGDGIGTKIECKTNTQNTPDGNPNTKIGCPDTDTDNTPDYQDLDTDGDGVRDQFEKGPNCLTLTNCQPQDTDADGKPNYRDNNDDNDTKVSNLENNDPNGDRNDADALDFDDDGLVDYLDPDDVAELLDKDIPNLKAKYQFDCKPDSTEVSTKITCNGKLTLNRRAPKTPLKVKVKDQKVATCTFESLTESASAFTCKDLEVGTKVGNYPILATLSSSISFNESQKINIPFDVARIFSIEGYAQTAGFVESGETITVFQKASAPLPRTGGWEIVISIISVVFIGVGTITLFKINQKKILKTDLDTSKKNKN
jgi:hypothetical protein